MSSRNDRFWRWVVACAVLLSWGCGSDGGPSGSLVPGNAGALSVTLKGLVVTLNWSAATLAGSSDGLQYKVVSSASPNILTALTAETNGTALVDWTADITTATVSVPEGITYLNVLVRKGDSKKAAYQMAKVTGDQTPPVPGANGALVFEDNGMILRWTAASDNVSSVEALSYKVLRSDQNNLDTAANAEANGVVVKDWTSNISSQSIVAPALGKSIFVTVLVRDEANNVAAYQVASHTVSDTVGPTPGNSGELTSDGITASSFTVTWGAATDDFSASGELQYKLVWSTTNNISTVSDAQSNGQTALDWSAATLSHSVTGLSEGAIVFVNVLVRDGSGNMAAYTPLSVTTSDATAPVPGGGGAIGFTNVTATAVTLSWEKATDNGTAQEKLEYRVLRSLSNNITTLTDADTNGTVVKDWTANLTAVIANKLDDALTYYFVVQVRDAAKNRATYQVGSVTTHDDTPPFAGGGGALAVSSLGSTQLTLMWVTGNDNVTLPAQLEYRVVGSTQNNIDTVENATKNGTVIKDWTANLTSATVLTLTQSTTYYFNVLVRDAAKNVGIYTLLAVTTADGEAPKPGNSGTLAVSDITASGFTVSWTKATDNVSTQDLLEYRLVRSLSANIGDPTKALANGTYVGEWTFDVATLPADQLSDSTAYYVNVLVRDAAGNVAAYEMTSVTTLDTTAPVPGGGGVLAFSAVAAQSLTINWQKAVDGVTPQGQLEYKVVRSANADIGDLNGAQNAATVVMDWTADVSSVGDSGLGDTTTYYYNVLVRDLSGNVAVYSMRSVTTDNQAPQLGGTGTLVFAKSQATSVSFTWTKGSDNVTDPEKLVYRVVRSDSDNVADLDGALANGTIVQDWTADIASATASGLVPDKTYFVNVIIRDEAGHMAAYQSLQIVTAEGVAPTFSGPISLAGKDAASVSLTWTKATDNATAAADVETAVFYTKGTGLQPLTAANVMANAVLGKDWTKDLDSATVSGLDDSTQYTFYLLARDAAGNLGVLATPLTVSTADGTPPLPGGAGVLTLQVGTRVRVSWTKGTDNLTAAASLKYQVITSQSDNISTATDAIKNGTPSMTATADVNEWVITGLDANTDHWVTVLIDDGAGNLAAYKSTKFTTKGFIWLYDAGELQLSSLSNRPTLNALCEAARASANIGTCDTSRAFVSLGGSDMIKNWSVLYGIPAKLVELKGPTGIYAADLDDFFSGNSLSTGKSLSDVGILPTGKEWVSQSNADGSNSDDSCVFNSTARVGDADATDAARISSQTVSCTASAYLLCLCY